MHWRYKTIKPLGTGGYGSVYLARDLISERDVALKTAGITDGRRLRREFLLMKSLGHPALPEAYDLSRDGDQWLLAMEHVPGTPLGDLSPDGPVDKKTALMVWARLADALRYLHQRGLVHGDLQPGNVMVSGEAVKLIDLGLARQSAAAPQGFAGLPAFAAPEQLHGGSELGPGADIYALGLLVWVMTGNAAPSAEQRLDPRAQWLASWNGALGERAQEVLFTMLRPDPWRRFGDGGELCAALAEAGIPTTPRDGGRAVFVGRSRELRAALRSIRNDSVPAVRVAAAAGQGATSFLLRLNALLQAAGSDSVYLDPRAMSPERFAALEIPRQTVILADGAGEATLQLLRKRGNQLVYAGAAAGPAGGSAVIALGPLTAAETDRLIAVSFCGLPRHEARALSAHLSRVCNGTAAAIDGRVGRYLASGCVTAADGRWRIDWDRLLESEDSDPGAAADLAALRERWRQARQDGTPGALIHYGKLLCLSGQLSDDETRQTALKVLDLCYRGGSLIEAHRFWQRLEPQLGSAAGYYVRLATLCGGAGDINGAAQAVARARELHPDEGEKLRLEAFGIWSRRGGREREAFAEMRRLTSLAEQLSGPALFAIREYLTQLALELQDWPALREASAIAARGTIDGVPAFDRGAMASWHGYALLKTGDLAGAERELEASLKLADDGLGDTGLVYILSNLALAKIASGSWNEAATFLDRALQAIPARQSDSYRAYLLVNRCIINEQMGQYRRSRDINYKAAAIYARSADHVNEVLTLANAAQLEQVLGNEPQADLLLQRCRELAADDATGPVQMKIRKEQLFVSLWRQRWAEAWELFQSYRALARTAGQREQWEAMVHGTIAAVESGDDHNAMALLDELRQRAGNDDQRNELELASAAHAALLRDGTDGIERMLAAAAAMDGRGRQLWAARARVWAARIALQRNDGDQAGPALAGLHAAESLLRRDGVAGLWRRCRDLIVELSRLELDQGGGGRSAVLLDGFYRLATVIGAAADDSVVAGTALQLAVELLAAERGGLFLMDGRGELVLAAQIGLDPATRQDARDYSREAVRRAAREGAEIVSNDAALDALFAGRASVQQNAIRSLLCAPVRYREGAIGALYLDSRLRHGVFSPRRRTFLAAWCAIIGSLLESNRMLAALRRENDALLGDEAPALRAMLGASTAMQRVAAEIRTIAPTDARVLITGESGTGKELVARAVHQLSPRRGGVFLAVDCGSLPAGLLEAELFGYVRGAFTGAYGDKDGLFAAADRGTIFLDEITSASPDVQAKLLRVIETGELRRVGDTALRRVDVRLICASNRDMEAEINAGRFKEDLFYRLNVLRLHLPPLRERGDDVLVLAEHFKDRFQNDHGRTGMRFSAPARSAMLGHAWPGNIRELENVVKRAVILTPGKVIGPEQIGLNETPVPGMDIRQETELVRRKRLAEALRTNGNNVTKTAVALGITRRQVHRLIAKYDLK